MNFAFYFAVCWRTNDALRPRQKPKGRLVKVIFYVVNAIRLNNQCFSILAVHMTDTLFDTVSVTPDFSMTCNFLLTAPDLT